MPSTTQIVPEHEYAHTMVVVHDNSARPSDAIVASAQSYCSLLYVFASPKGIDRELRTIQPGKSTFVENYGLGDFDTYGQPFLNAYNAALTNAATLHCLRVTADDATYSMGALVAHYKATPGSTDPEEPEVKPSDKVDVMGHANVVASDEVDEGTGALTIRVAGTNVTPGISEENKATFGDVTGNYIDITVNLAKLITLDNSKTYQVVQKNPALAQYVGKDEYVDNVDGVYTKTKTYTGAALVDGYSLLLGGDSTVTLEIVEWGTTQKPETVYIENNTDMGLIMADSKAHAKVTKTGTDYKVELTGDVVAGVLHADLWGDIPAEYVELNLLMPVDLAKKYRVVQTDNPALSMYPEDPNISQEEGKWVKSKEYTGNDIHDGYAVLLGKTKSTITVGVYDADSFVSTKESTPLYSVSIVNDYKFVTEHTETPEVPGPIGEQVTATIISTLGFVGDTSKSSVLRARAAINKVMRNITKAGAEGEPGKMQVYYTFEAAEAPVTDITNLGNIIEVNSTPDAQGYTAVKVFEMAYKGRGKWGDNIRFVLNSYARGDRLSTNKNYTLSIYEINNATLVKKEEFTCAFDPNAVSTDGTTLFVDYLVGDPYKNSNYISIVSNPGALKDMFAAYVNLFPDTHLTEQTFDPLCGFEFGSSLTMIEGLEIDSTSNGVVSLSGASGIALMGGSDGAFDVSNVDRQKALNDAYLKAYAGEIDRNVKSRKMFPTDIIFDANFAPETKIAIAELVNERQDCMGIFDLGTEFNTFAGLMEELAEIEPYVTSRNESVEGYYGKIQDPTNFKIIKVTGTYALSSMYPLHFQQHGSKHVPLAGSSYAIMSNFLNGSAYPIFDDDLDATLLDQLTNSKVNFLKGNTQKQVVRGAQTTRQDADTNLSEMNNVFVLLDIRRDAVQMCEQYEYNFAESEDLQRFNKSASILADKYQDAQVKSITAEFSMNDWESERGILHLYIEFVHKNIIKRAIVEIDVNRGTVVA